MPPDGGPLLAILAIRQPLAPGAGPGARWFAVYPRELALLSTHFSRGGCWHGFRTNHGRRAPPGPNLPREG